MAEISFFGLFGFVSGVASPGDIRHLPAIIATWNRVGHRTVGAACAELEGLALVAVGAVLIVAVADDPPSHRAKHVEAALVVQLQGDAALISSERLIELHTAFDALAFGAARLVVVGVYRVNRERRGGRNIEYDEAGAEPSSECESAHLSPSGQARQKNVFLTAADGAAGLESIDTTVGALFPKTSGPPYAGDMSVFVADCLAGRTALITGGGTGICRGIAHAMLSHGARVCITSRKQEVLDKTAAELADETGGEVIAVAADVRDPDAIAAAVAKTVEAFGALDTVVNGAAGNFLAPAIMLSMNGFKTVIEIDLVGTFNTCKASFEHLKSSGDAVIINISATLQIHGTPLQSHAAAAKAGVDSLTRSLAVEWGSLGIRVNAIAPGPIRDTEGMRRLAPGDAAQRFTKHIPLKRFGEVREIADMAVFLSSSAARYITGAVIVVDGGQSIAVPAFTD